MSLLRVAGDAARSTRRGACSLACSMDIVVFECVARGLRVGSSECVLCQACIKACPEYTRRLSAGLDHGGPELLRERT